MKRYAIFLLLFFIASCEKTKIIDQPLYAIGNIIAFTHISGNLRTIQFYYDYGGDRFDIVYSDGHNGWSIPSQVEYKSGDKYMVQFNANDHNEARMLFDYPVKDSSDFMKDTAYFATHTP